VNAPRFPPDAVARIRQLHTSGLLNVRAWAQAYNVSLETVRRIARGDTYRDGAQPAAALAQVIPPQAPLEGEPDSDALAASFARLAAAQAAEAGPPPAQDLLDELMARGRVQPGLPGVPATRPGALPDEDAS
jgi:hypothetical protein